MLSVCLAPLMPFTPKSAARLWFFALESIVVGIPALMYCTGNQSLYPQLVNTIFICAWPALLITSIVLTRYHRPFAYLGFASCLWGGLWSVLPVIRY